MRQNYECERQRISELHQIEIQTNFKARCKMQKDFNIELGLKDVIIEQKNKRVDDLKFQIAKMLKMIKYPRLVDLANK